jgi:hypothetical protein
MARRTKRTPNVQQVIARALAAGNTRENAARLAGIDYSTLKRWCRLSAPFRAALEKAEAEAEELYVSDITCAARDGSWQAAAWWLERRRHPHWRKPVEQVEHVHRHIREQAEEIAAESGIPVEQVERDIVLQIEAMR